MVTVAQVARAQWAVGGALPGPINSWQSLATSADGSKMVAAGSYLAWEADIPSRHVRRRSGAGGVVGWHGLRAVDAVGVLTHWAVLGGAPGQWPVPVRPGSGWNDPFWSPPSAGQHVWLRRFNKESAAVSASWAYAEAGYVIAATAGAWSKPPQSHINATSKPHQSVLIARG